MGRVLHLTGRFQVAPARPTNEDDMARILVVDDAAFMRRMVSDVLTSGGHEVVGEAADGNEAVERYQELRPDVMTLDITMPEKDGLTALRELIAIDPGATVVMCSALGQESKVLEAVKAGAKDFIAKPFEPQRVLTAIEKVTA
jgi:two-component system chemotaxis response regulator CheY